MIKIEIYERIKYLRKEVLNMSQEKFGAELGVNRDVINNIERNRLKKPEQKEPLYQLTCTKFDINEEWLRTGEGDMFVQQSIDDKIASFIGGIQMTEDNSFKRRLISVLANLKEEQWEMLAEIAENLTTEKG